MIYFWVSLVASIVGSICGIGGGVIIKPVLDLLQLGDVSTISFLSSCTVLSMSCYSVGKSILSCEKMVNTKVGTPMALGAAIGGVTGKRMFSSLCELFANINSVGTIQSLCLAAVTIGTLLYTVNKPVRRTLRLSGFLGCGFAGMLLGILSSFLGIGGGPVNLVVLRYLFSMETKSAAANSLYIILFSQIASLAVTILTQSVPVFHWGTLVVMIAGGIGGGIIGRAITKKICGRAVDKLFIILMIIIIGISIHNSFACLN